MFIIICSFDNIQSLENIDLWLNHINNFSKILNKNLVHFIPIVILVNKNDLKNTEKKFKFSDVNQKIKDKKLNITAYPFSAKDLNFKDVFEKIEFFLDEKNQKNNNNNNDNNREQYHSDNTPNTYLSNSRNKSDTFRISRRSVDTTDCTKSSGSCC